MFRNVEFGPEFSKENELRSKIEKSFPVLAGVGVPPDRARISWNLRTDEHSTPVIRLTLHDWNVDLSKDFSITDFEQPQSLRRPFLHMWGELLEMASDRNIKRIKEWMNESGDD
jgi:hypothetical protein